LSRDEVGAIMISMGFDIDMNELGFIDCIMQVAGDIDHNNLLTREELNSHKKKNTETK
jgi:hypothetical protein